MTASAIKGLRSRRKGVGSTTGAARYTHVEHLHSGGRVQRPNLGSLTVYLQPCHSYILAQPMASTDCKSDRATNEVSHCHPIAHPSDTASLQCALRPSQPPFTRCFMPMSCVLYPPRSPPELQLPPIAEDAAGLLAHAFQSPSTAP